MDRENYLSLTAAEEFWSEAVEPAITANRILQETCRIASNKEKALSSMEKEQGLLLDCSLRQLMTST